MLASLPALGRARLALFFAAILIGSILVAPSIFAQSTIQGIVLDPSGTVIQNAQVEALHGSKAVASTVTDASGHYSLSLRDTGSYELRIAAPAFQSIVRQVEAGSNTSTRLDIVLQLDRLSQQVTVTATGMPTLQQDIGSAVTVLTAGEFQHTVAVAEPLRLVPGAQIVQSGQPGGITSLYIRGGNSDANKVLMDGISINDIGGAINFANLASTGIEKIEVLRGPNSTLYGADALAGVVSLSTPRGTTPLPQLDYLVEGGNFGTYRQEGTLSGKSRSFDYFTDYSRFDTSNTIPRDQFHLGTLTSDFGWSFNPANSLRATIHHDQAAAGGPNALLLYGIPDSTKQGNEDSYAGVAFENQTGTRWHNEARYGLIRLRSLYTDFTPTGIPQYDEDGDVVGYLGAPVTIKGGNGYSVSGQAQYQFVEEYPNTYATSTDRDLVSAQSDYAISPHAVALFGFKYENERGYAGSPFESINRDNYDYTLQIAGDLFGRLHYLIGSGLEKNGLYGFAATPRASLAYVFVEPGGNSTKLRASFSKGIQEPNLNDQESSLFTLLSELPDGPALIAQYHILPIGPEDSRSFDGGVDQSFANNRGRVSLTLFHSQYTNEIEYVPQQGLLELGVPQPVVDDTPYGATLNSQAFRAQGVEFETEYQIGSHWFARGGYTYLDAVIQHSFSSDSLGPSFNPNIPDIPIGAYSPLRGARPFRRSPHTGYFGLSYRQSRFDVQATGSLIGRRDDSDFLAYDANYEGTLLLPNRNLDPSYQRVDLVANYRVGRRITVFSSVQNLLSEHYQEVFGYPSLPFAFRSGVKVSFGGESWKLK